MRMQEVYAGLVRDGVSPAMKAAGMRKQGRATWWERRPNGGWVLVMLQGNRWNSAEQVEFWGEVVCWPPGTWEFECEFYDLDPGDRRPSVAANAPVDVDARVSGACPPDGWRLDATADVDALAEEVVAWLEATVEVARACSDDVDRALSALVDGPGWPGWRPTYAIAMLRAVAPNHPRLPEIVHAKTTAWLEDPRPITLRPYLVEWRDECGLPEVELPTFWSPSMQGRSVQRFGSAQAAFRAGFGTSFQYADGTTSDEPPAGWLEQDPVTHGRRWWRRRG